eukprot:5643965-Alexandrium_andersonii.AAC.1
MPDIGEPVFPDGSNEDVGDEMTYLVNLMEAPAGSQEGLGGRRAPVAPAPEEAVGLARALFAAGATLGE